MKAAAVVRLGFCDFSCYVADRNSAWKPFLIMASELGKVPPIPFLADKQLFKASELCQRKWEKVA